MYSVSRRSRKFNQPRGGLVNIKSFKEYEVFKFAELYAEENISPSIVGMTVDYMTRYVLTANKEKSFSISLIGAKMCGEFDAACELLEGINGVDNESIKNACKLVGYDASFRAGPGAFVPISQINPDSKTIYNILIMIKRSEEFFKEYGPVVLSGFTFQGAYTKIVSSGDADFFTDDTLWDFKVSKNSLNSQQTLQLYMYYLMGCRTDKLNSEYNFKNRIKNIGFFNPRLSKVYIKKVSEIRPDIKKYIETEAIGYED